MSDNDLVMDGKAANEVMINEECQKANIVVVGNSCCGMNLQDRRRE